MCTSLARVSTVASCFLLMCLVVTLAPACVRAQSPEQESALTKDQQDARDALNQGVAAFKNAQFDEAVRLFQRAKQLDPHLLNATLYLATACASQYIPGAEYNPAAPCDGKSAAREYKEVLDKDPRNLNAIDGLASILFQMAGQPFSPEIFEESKSYHKKHIELRPNDPQPYYSIGVIDWALAYRANGQLREEFNQSVGGEGLKNTDPLPEVIRRKYAVDYGAIIDEGIESLKHAIQLKPDYDDAMVYLNLMYRRKADVVASAAEREQLTRQADDLLDRVKDIKQKKVESAQ